MFLVIYVGYLDIRLEVVVKVNEIIVVDIIFNVDEGGVDLEEVVVVEKVLECSENVVLMLCKKVDKV